MQKQFSPSHQFKIEKKFYYLEKNNNFIKILFLFKYNIKNLLYLM